VLATDLLHRAVAAQPGQHDLDLLPGRPAPVLALLAQPSLLVGRAAHAEPAAGQSLRRYAPPRLPGTPSQLPVNAGPGSAAPTMPYRVLRGGPLPSDGRLLARGHVRAPRLARSHRGRRLKGSCAGAPSTREAASSKRAGQPAETAARRPCSASTFGFAFCLGWASASIPPNAGAISACSAWSGR
jgi:hypothetical protein